MADYPTIGNDTLLGTAGADNIDGLAGNDTITGLSGNDTLIGGTGDDIFVIGGTDFGYDIYNGGDGADIIRLWALSVDFTEDHRIGDEILKGVGDQYRKLRNTVRYLLGALSQFFEYRIARTI
mgnify:CR=1 FL=1